MEAENPIFILINFVVIYTRAVLCYSCSIIFLFNNNRFVVVFFYIVKCSLPLKVNVKYNVLKIQFGYKEYSSSLKLSG